MATRSPRCRGGRSVSARFAAARGAAARAELAVRGPALQAPLEVTILPCAPGRGLAALGNRLERTVLPPSSSETSSSDLAVSAAEVPAHPIGGVDRSLGRLRDVAHRARVAGPADLRLAHQRVARAGRAAGVRQRAAHLAAPLRSRTGPSVTERP